MELNKLQAYELLRHEQIPDIQSEGFLLRHKKSGARIMLIKNDDENKVFSITFRTTPRNSTGVAHIMEHTVLCGSRKFPVRDPFVELAKGSMNTFLNAMTFPDKTMFPLASCNDKDFANLMDVYLDSVFYPNIYQKEEIFRQEGWHYQLDSPDDEIVYNGVVYNEMKGAFSSPDDVVEREILASLFPDTTYHYESGGDPAVIPELSYEEYLDFHRTYYHPSNSYIYLYGDMDFSERLEWLDAEYLSKFDTIKVSSDIPLQAPFEEMQVQKASYPVGQEGSEEDGTYLTWNAVIGNSLDTKLSSAFAVLDYVLLSSPGAPLKQALLDAGIGMDVLSSYDSGIFQPVFSVIAKGANGRDQQKFAKIIEETLEKIAGEGVDKKAVLAAVNVMEFRFREADFGQYPRGLMYAVDVFDSWLYDDERPFDYLRQLDDFAFLKEQAETDYYERLIRQYLLENTHKSLVVVSPQKGLTAFTEKKTREKLDAFKASLDNRQIDELVKKTEKLRLFQETPSTQEELEKIPLLSREDLQREAKELKNKVCFADGAWLVHHDYRTNGIAYLQLLFDCSKIPAEDLVYLSLLRSLLGMVDTKNYTYTDLANEINMNTGGISPGLSLFPDSRDAGRVRLGLGIKIRTLYDRIPYCFDMVREILFTSNLEQEKRILEIIRQIRAGLSTKLTASGSATALTRAMSGFSMTYYINDSIDGVRFYDMIRDLEDHFEEKKEFLFNKLHSILQIILSGRDFLVDYTGGEEEILKIREGISALMAQLTKELDVDQSQAAADPTTEEETADAGTAKEEMAAGVLRWYPAVEKKTVREGLKTPAKVQYTARCGNFREDGFEYTGALRVLRTILNFEYLWTNIRVVGGAYGCGGSFNTNGDVCLTSYRDPQLRKTLEVFEGVPDFLESFTVSERDMTKYVIGTVSDLDIPLTPAMAGARSLRSLLTGMTPAKIQKIRDEVLDADQESIRALSPLTKAVLEQGCCCVVGNEDRIMQESDLFDTVREL